jgi:hypothetical protein
VTNIDTGITQAATDPALNDPTRASFLMLVTDGAQSAGCTAGGGDAGSEAAVQNLFATRGITTFVVGFGGAVDAVQLDKLAIAGGAPQPGPAIAGQVVGCSYLVDPPPDDPSQIYVWLEKTESIPRDTSHVMGWDYDPATQLLTL